MADTQTALPNSASRSGFQTDTAIYAAGFVVFFAIALVAQVLGQPWRSWLPGAEGVKSLTGGVKASVYTFMSYLN